MSKREPARDGETRRGSLLQASCWLALILLLAKAATAGAWFPNPAARLLVLIASSYRDLLFALGCGLVGEFALWLVRNSRTSSAFVRAFGLGLFALFAGYAVAAIGLFRYFNRPVTYELLTLVGNAAAVRSSIFSRITVPIGIALLAAPALLLLASFLPVRRRAMRMALGASALWIVAGWGLHQSGWREEELEYLALSPHAELLRTAARHLAGGQRPAFPKDYPPGYADEFRTFGARGSSTQGGFSLPEGVARPRNVIVIVLESVGTKYLGLYGNRIDVTPNLTAASQNALVFDNIYAQASFTYASFRPINFSVYPGLPWHYALLEDARPVPQTLASLMRARGSRTAYFTSGDLDWGDQRWLLERHGEFETLAGAADLGCPLLSSWGAEDHCAFDRLLNWIDAMPNESFFTVCWTDQTHDPFVVTPGAVLSRPGGKYSDDLSRYLTNLQQIDAQIGRLLVGLRERGLADDTLVVITGDHGEAFADPHQQRGHAWSVFDEEVRVPLLLWNPRLFPQPQRAATIGGHVDLNPSLADLLAIPAPSEWQGHSLFDPARPPRAYFMAIAGGDLFGVREGDWKYIYDVTSGREMLFNLPADPHEQRNVAADEPARCTDLRKRVAAWVTFEDAYLWGREN